MIFINIFPHININFINVSIFKYISKVHYLFSWKVAGLYPLQADKIFSEKSLKDS